MIGEAVWHDVECGSYSADLPLWRELATAASSAAGECELLELGCGTGRVSLALARRGCRVTGLEVRPELVEVLRRRAARLGVPISTVVADARSFELSARFDLVLAPMQLVQLLRSRRERSEMLACIARHLKPRGCAALALLDPDDELGVGEPPPFPDVQETNGWVYASQPVAVRQAPGTTIEIERVRRAVSPSGEITEQLHRDLLEPLPCEQVEQEAGRVGFHPEPRRRVPATRDHVASVVVVLRSDG
jgi:SAM-dependent methyltransferase